MTWTMQEKARAAALVVLAALMIALPVYQLVDGGLRFGWRMFGLVQILPEFSVIDDTGAVVEIDAERYTANLRGDVAYAEALPPHLCSVIEGARLVMITTATESSEYRC